MYLGGKRRATTAITNAHYDNDTKPFSTDRSFGAGFCLSRSANTWIIAPEPNACVRLCLQQFATRGTGFHAFGLSCTWVECMCAQKMYSCPFAARSPPAIRETINLNCNHRDSPTRSPNQCKYAFFPIFIFI